MELAGRNIGTSERSTAAKFSRRSMAQGAYQVENGRRGSWAAPRRPDDGVLAGGDTEGAGRLTGLGFDSLGLSLTPAPQAASSPWPWL